MIPAPPAILGGSPVFPKGSPAWPGHLPEVAEVLAESVASGTWGDYFGPNHATLCTELQEFHDVRHAVLYCSGTAAIEMALRGLNVGLGEEVVLSAYDFKGNFQDILTVGARPVLVDVEPENWSIDLAQLAEAVTEQTRAVIVTHLHGATLDMPAICRFAAEHNLAVIEDACQVPGARIAGRRAGTWGDVGVLSFGGSKLLSAGRGGALLTNRDDVVQRNRIYTQRGNEAYPLSELQAAALRPQLKALDERNRLRQETVDMLRREGLGTGRLAGLRPFQPRAGDESAWYKLGLLYESSAFAGLSAAEFAAAMRAEGVALFPGFDALQSIHSRRRFRAVNDLPVSAASRERVLVLHHPILLEGPSTAKPLLTAIEKIRISAAAVKERLVDASERS